MRDKDQIILENIYDKIENVEAKTPDNFSSEDDLDVDVSNEDNTNNIYSLVASEFSERAHPSDKIFDYLNDIKKSGSITSLISFLNESEDWIAKDKFIEFLFQYYIPS